MTAKKLERVPRVVGGRHHAKDQPPRSVSFDATLTPFGEHRRLLSIGSLSIELRGLDERLAALVDANYEGFLEEVGSSSVGTERRIIELGRAQSDFFLYLPRAEGLCEEARMDARTNAERLELWSYFFAGCFGREGRSGRLLLCPAGEIDTSNALENYLRFFVSTAALAGGGFLLHSAGVLREGKSYLFFGPSGAGKSTASANVPDGTERLGDDLVLIERTDASYDACGVPFRGSFVGQERNASGRGPLQLACRLFQAPENRLEEVARIVQVAELLGELPFLLDDKELQLRATSNASHFVKSIPVRRLYLRKDPSYWQLLD